MNWFVNLKLKKHNTFACDSCVKKKNVLLVRLFKENDVCDNLHLSESIPGIMKMGFIV